MKLFNKSWGKLLSFSLLLGITSFNAFSASKKTQESKPIMGDINSEADAQKVVSQEGGITIDRVGNLLAKIPLPSVTINLLKGLAIKTPTIKSAKITQLGNPIDPKAPEGTLEATFVGNDAKKFDNAFVIAGSVIVSGSPVNLSITVSNNKGVRGMSVELSLPERFKYSEIDPKLTSLDSYKSPSFRLIVSSFDYIQNSSEIIRRGVSLKSDLPITGAFSPVKKFIDHMNKLRSRGVIVGMEGRPELECFVALDGKKWMVSGRVPARVGYDFTKGGRSNTKILKSVTTGDLLLAIALQGTKVSLNLRAGIIMDLVSQSEKIQLISGVDIGADSIALVGRMDGMYDPAFGQKGFGFGNLGVEIRFAYDAPMLAAGIPFDKIGFRGAMRLEDVKAAVAAGVRLSATETPDFVFDGSISKINISKFVWAFSRMIGKDVSMKNILPIEFADLRFWVAPSAMSIADKQYHRGIGASGAIKIGNFSGEMSFDVIPDLNVMRGKGRLSPIKTKIFTITGKGFDKKYGTSDDGLALDLDIGGKEKKLYGSGMITVPAFNGSADIDMDFMPNAIAGNAEFKLFKSGESTIHVEIPVATKSGKASVSLPEQSVVEFNYKNSLLKELRKAIHEMAKTAKYDIEKWRKKEIADSKKDIDRAKDKAKKYQKEYEARKKRCGVFHPIDCAQAVLNKMKKQWEDARSLSNKLQQELVKRMAKFSKKLVNAMDKVAEKVDVIDIKDMTLRLKKGKLHEHFRAVVLGKNINVDADQDITTFVKDVKNISQLMKHTAKKVIEKIKKTF